MTRPLDQEEHETKRRLIKNQYQMLTQQTALNHQLEAQRRKGEKYSVAAYVQSWMHTHTFLSVVVSMVIDE